MFDRWFRKRKRARLVARSFPHQWEQYLELNVMHFRQLSSGEQSRSRDYIRIFVDEKNWEGCGGLKMTDEIRVTIAAQASLLALGLENVYFDHVLSILVYPTAYVAPVTENTAGGFVVEGSSTRMGEAWWRGPVILSWSDVLAGGRLESPGQNVVFHEFAHQLDMMNGRIVDGTPILGDQQQYERWVEAMTSEYERLVNDCQRGQHGILDCYGASSPGEFFAVLTEVFFENSARLRYTHPELYSVLSDFYRQDPARWPSLDQA